MGLVENFAYGIIKIYREKKNCLNFQKIAYLWFFFFAEKFGSRHFVTFMLFLGMANAYVMRTNMSVAIVAMVNHTAIDAGNKDIFDDECPNYINTTTPVS